MASILNFPSKAVEPAKVETPLKVVDRKRPPRPPYIKAPKKYLEEHEIRAMMAACYTRKDDQRKRRTAERDALAIYFGWEQALRACEIVGTMWMQFDFDRMTYTPRRAKGSCSDPNPISKELAKMLKSWHKHQPFKSLWVFTDWHPKAGSFKRNCSGPPRKQLTDAISTRTLTDILHTAARRAGIQYNVHNHMLKHGTGFWHYSKGRDIRATQRWMGHKSLSSTLIYAPMVEPTRDQLPHGD